ncbi:hypothetical protein Tco_0527495 [Tanacetum coccineum]
MDDEEYDEVTKELYNDVNMNLGNRDDDMTDADQGGADQQNISQESGFEQVEEDAHVTLTQSLTHGRLMNQYKVLLGVETAETKIKTPPLDQTERRKEGSQARKLSHPEIQGQRKRSLQAPSKHASHSQHKPSGKSAHAEELSHKVNDSGVQQDQKFNTAFELLKGTCKSLTELEYHLEECSKSTTERLDQHNPEVKLYPFDLSKPLPLIPYHRGHQVIPQDFFINNDLKYLKGGDLSRWYRSKSENNGKVPTEMELVLEQTQQEHQSDTKVLTMTMEILPEPTSNKLCVKALALADGASYKLSQKQQIISLKQPGTVVEYLALITLDLLKKASFSSSKATPDSYA